MQFLAGLQIELVDHADNSLRCARTQRFQQCPQTVVAMRRLHQDRAGRLKSETVKAVSGQMTALARSMVRHHVNGLFVSRRCRDVGAKACEHCYDKTESGGKRCLRCRDDLMKRAAVKTAIQQVAIKCGKAERKPGLQRLGPPWMPGQQKAQFGQDGGATLDRSCRRKCWRNKHLMALLRIE